ncbi:MAG: hypothetical protein N3F65_02855 [Nitrososphaeria archaeon]|nr:hypothetical protein [Aigarchaeota archaeon]MCX8187532.1 hypothetical protein [Nitrososphaeria archaeon]MDW8021493.1 hypothetical protein [Nitrososphaerota archaeon]
MNGSMIFLSLEEIRRNQDLLIGLSFPAREINYSLMVLGELEEMGVDGVYSEATAAGLRIAVIGKGYRGYIVKGRMRGLDAAVKILRTDAALGGFDREAELTMMANGIGVGPKLLGSSQHALVLEYVEGKHLGKWIEELSVDEVDALKNVLRKSFLQARSLDGLGLDHGELSDARKHVIVKPDLEPVIIDFGKARIKGRPSNVTSLFNYITFGQQSGKILQMLGVREPPIHVSQRYKRDPGEKSFNELMAALNL